jgi:hypothetical protein
LDIKRDRGFFCGHFDAKSQKFSVLFPVNGNWTESGSLWTLSTATESISFRICHLNSVDHPHLAGKLRFCQHSENQVYCNDAAFVPEFSEGNSGSSFFEWKWTAGSMSGLVGEVKLQIRSLKMDVLFEILLGLAK